MLSPRNRKANPIRNEPKSLTFCFLENEDKTNPTKMSGIAIAPKLKEPSILTANSQAVTVVPMFAPMITPMALRSVIRPAFTKLTSMSVVAVDDCTRTVTRNPVNRHLPVLDVIFSIKERRPLPANF